MNQLTRFQRAESYVLTSSAITAADCKSIQVDLPPRRKLRSTILPKLWAPGNFPGGQLQTSMFLQKSLVACNNTGASNYYRTFKVVGNIKSCRAFRQFHLYCSSLIAPQRGCSKVSARYNFQTLYRRLIPNAGCAVSWTPIIPVQQRQFALRHSSCLHPR